MCAFSWSKHGRLQSLLVCNRNILQKNLHSRSQMRVAFTKTLERTLKSQSHFVIWYSGRSLDLIRILLSCAWQIFFLQAMCHGISLVFRYSDFSVLIWFYRCYIERNRYYSHTTQSSLYLMLRQIPIQWEFTYRFYTCRVRLFFRILIDISKHWI